MNKLKINIMVDIIMFIIFIPVAISSFVLHFADSPGRTEVLGLTLHSWSKMHTLTGFIFIGLMVIHLALHWYIIKNIPKILKQ
ncbi:MAG: DUF4405 domain-containing protein [Nanoarchaeota archaeon]|nr:DUF4405 domain-containing protein [Nanoarchaeota archaeon]